MSGRGCPCNAAPRLLSPHEAEEVDQRANGPYRSSARPRLLSTQEARETIVARLQPTVDRLRQRITRFGLNPYEVFLVWTRWTGPDRGEGTERILKRTAILPSPKVEDLTAISLQFFTAGTLPVGSVRVSRISGSYAADLMMGLTVPPDPQEVRDQFIAGNVVDPKHDSLNANEVLDPYEFFWEIVDDGRSNHGRLPRRQRFRPMSQPFRRAEKMDWIIILERISDDLTRAGQPRLALPQAGEDDD